jgi:hypothetical protein
MMEDGVIASVVMCVLCGSGKANKKARSSKVFVCDVVLGRH